MRWSATFIVLWGSYASAQISNSAANAVNAAVGLFAHYTQKEGTQPLVAKDEIGGCCFPRGTVLILKSEDGKRIAEQTLSEETFCFMGVKPGVYDINYKHLSFIGERSLSRVSTGKWVSVTTSSSSVREPTAEHDQTGEKK